MGSPPARSVYEVKLNASTGSDIANGVVGTLFANFVSALFSFGGVGFSASITLEVIDRRTGRSVLTMREQPSSVNALARMMEADLDRLDGSAFAKEWSLDAPP